MSSVGDKLHLCFDKYSLIYHSPPPTNYTLITKHYSYTIVHPRGGGRKHEFKVLTKYMFWNWRFHRTTNCACTPEYGACFPFNRFPYALSCFIILIILSCYMMYKVIVTLFLMKLVSQKIPHYQYFYSK